MKKIYLSMMALFVALLTQAQVLTPTVISSTGGFSQNANNSLSYTVGEMSMVQTFSAGGSILTQGFQQPNEILTGLINLNQTEAGSLAVYPNPAVDNMWYGFEFPAQGKVTAAIYNEAGQKVSDIYQGNYTNGKTIEQLNVSSFAAGVYFLTLNFTGTDNNTSTISRKFQVIN